MSKSYVIEVGDDQAGVIIREDGEREYRFHAALERYSALEGRHFANALLAERAAVAHAVSRRRRRAEILAREGATL
jgi:cytidine deaminase